MSESESEKFFAQYFLGWQLEVCVPECHFPEPGFFLKKFGKFPVLTVLENPFPGPGLVPAFGTGCFLVLFQVEKHSGIPKRFLNENYLFGPFPLFQMFHC